MAAALPATTATAASVATWDKVAQCESSGNWSANTGNGFYGGLQFTASTWQAYGGTAYAPRADLATKQQQILIAEKVLAGQGEGAWPNCGPKNGLGSDHADPYPPAPTPTPPVSTVTGPSAGDIVSGTVTLSAKVTDTVGTVTGASFSVDGAVVGTDTAGSAGTYAVALDTTTLTEGEHTLTARATNDAGQTGAASAGVSFFVANRATAARTTGDFNGDGKDDIAVLYNYSNVDSALFTFTSTGKSDVAALYNYSNVDSGLFTFTSTGTGFSAPVKNWESGEGNWNWDRSKIVAGDFTGDGKADIAALYNYGNVDSAVFTFTSTGSGFAAPVKNWDSGEGNWNWDRSKIVAGDFTGDGKADIAALYNYSNVNSGLFTFTSTGTGFSAPVKNWDSGVGGWNWDRTKLDAGDFNGDGKADIGALYNYGNVDSAVWRFTSTGTGFSNPVKNWDSGEGGWNWDRSDLA
jgi:hypothetical protein